METALVNKKRVLFVHNNARSQVDFVIRDNMRRLGWKTLYHSPYFPELFPSPENDLRGKSSANETETLCIEDT